MLQFMHTLIQMIFVLVAFILAYISLVNSKGYNVVVPVALIIALFVDLYIVVVWRKQGWLARIASSMIGIVALWVVYEASIWMVSGI
jgi:hypothetical protein